MYGHSTCKNNLDFWFYITNLLLKRIFCFSFIILIYYLVLLVFLALSVLLVSLKLRCVDNNIVVNSLY